MQETETTPTAQAADDLPDTVKSSARHYVWDGPTRLFHWLLVALLAFSWWSAENYRMDWHYQSGLAICGLVVFRLLWGVFGTSTARFRQFVKGPQGVWRYVRGEEAASIGHNPLGGWSVIALLLVLITQVVSGLFGVDIDGIESGPLSYLVSFDQGRFAADIHHISFSVLQGLVVLHVLAILFYLVVKRRNLIGTMITGYERTYLPVSITKGGWAKLGLVVVAALLVTWWISGGARIS